MLHAFRLKEISHSCPLILFVAIAVIMSFGHDSHVNAAVITVNSLSDAASADGSCTLREAILNANLDSTGGSVDCAAGSGADTIAIAVAGTIGLTQPLPDLSSDMTIDGLGISQTTITRSGSAPEFRIFTKTAGAATISRLTISGGVVRGAAGPTGESAVGGGIRSNSGPLTLDTVRVSSNQVISGYRTGLGGFVSSAIGGGVYSFHALTLINSQVIQNSATGGDSSIFAGLSQGGGIAAIGPLTITDSNISHNSSTGGNNTGGRGGPAHGGGIYILPGSQPGLTAEAVITGSTISDNRSTGGDGTYVGPLAGGVATGAGVETEGGTVTLRLSRSVISNNVATAGNGGFSLGGGFRINPSSHLFASDCLISGNKALGPFGGYGGGIGSEGDLTVTGSTVTGNEGSDGGGINAQSETIIDRTTISNNTATGAGNTSGGIDFFGLTLSVTNSTISGNVATGTNATSGGMWIGGGDSVTMINSTIANNFASGPESASGIILERQLPYATISLKNTIVAGGVKNRLTPDVAGRAAFTSQGNNLIGNPGEHSAVFTQPGDQKGTSHQPLDPGLAPLGNYGGNVFTHALLDAGAKQSTAINAGASSGAPATDQRGAARVGNVDIGAFEANSTYVAQLPDGFVGRIYDQTIAEDIGGFEFSSTGVLPPGTTLRSLESERKGGSSISLSIFGTPTQAGDYEFSLSAEKGGGSVTINYRIVIRE
jgi:CSLREA domain-containing protein